MRKSLLDSSTLFDVLNATRYRNESWAITTLRHLLEYKQSHPKLTISGLTVFEFLDGLYRSGDVQRITHFNEHLLPSYDVLQPNLDIEDKAAEINAKLAIAGKKIGVVDSLIAATAIIEDLPLVTANPKHFQRVSDSGFPLAISNWREA